MRAEKQILVMKSEPFNYKLLRGDLGAREKDFAFQQREMRNYQPDGYLHQEVGLKLFETYIPHAQHESVPQSTC